MDEEERSGCSHKESIAHCFKVIHKFSTTYLPTVEKSTVEVNMFMGYTENEPRTAGSSSFLPASGCVGTSRSRDGSFLLARLKGVGPVRRYTFEFKRRIVELVKRGNSPGELSKVTGVSDTTIRSWLYQMEAPSQNGAKPVEQPAEKLPTWEEVASWEEKPVEKEEEKPVPFLDVQILYRLDRIVNTLEELLKVWKE